MRRYSIAFVGQRGIPASFGGVEKHVEELTKRLVAEGHRVISYNRSSYAPESRFYKGVRLHRLPAIPEKHFEMISHTILSFINLLDKDVDIVHVQSVDPALASFLPKIKTKVVATSHGQAYRRDKWGATAKLLSRFAERVYIHLPDARIAVSKTLKRYYESRYGCKVNYIPNAVDITTVQENVKDKVFYVKDSDSEVKLSKGDYILYVGRILPTKGVDILIDAWNRVNVSAATRRECKLAIVGGSSYTDSYVRMLKTRSNETIAWLDYRYGEELKWLFNNAYAAVLPSEIEGLAITLLEAMSYGRCVIYSDIPENLEVAEGIGISFENKNADDLAKKIELALRNEPLCRELGEKAVERIKKEYQWDLVVSLTSELYDSLFR